MARFVSADGVVPGAGALTAWPSDATAAPLFAQGPKDKDGNSTAPHNPQTLNRYSYGWNNPVRNTDPTGHCSSGLSWGMVNGQCYQEAFQQYMDPSRSLTDRAIGFIYAQADIALVSVAIAASYGLGSAIVGSGTAAASTTLLAEAQRIGSSTVTQVREHVLWRHADLLGITIKGNMQDSSNPMVQTALERINSISNAPERIIANTFKGREVFEYIASGIGVVRDRTTGEVVTILSRDAAGMQKLQGFVDNGTAKWLK